MTTRELRQILTAVENQEMTVRELRSILFEIEDQDAEITDCRIARLTMQEPEEEQKPEEITVREFIIQGALKAAEERLEKLEEMSAPTVVIEGQRKTVESLKAGELKIGGDKEVLEDVFTGYEKKTGRGGKSYYIINGGINFFPAAQYGMYIKKA